MMQLYNKVCRKVSRVVTRSYSTSFSLGIRMFHRRLRPPIYSIYGFVRFADEIVDTFHDHEKEQLLNQFRQDTEEALDRKLSLNPILHSFQEVVHEYGIERRLIEAFLESMEMDLYHEQYDREVYDRYIYGSAEVVGLMCLRVFVEGNDELYRELEHPAKRLGAAFQKVNFLRDIRADYEDRGRVYFPQVIFDGFDNEMKGQIEEEIQEDFDMAWDGIQKLPAGSRFGVHLAYVFYKHLFHKIQRSDARLVTKKRIRISNMKKFVLLCTTAFKDRINWS